MRNRSAETLPLGWSWPATHAALRRRGRSWRGRANEQPGLPARAAAARERRLPPPDPPPGHAGRPVPELVQRASRRLVPTACVGLLALLTAAAGFAAATAPTDRRHHPGHPPQRGRPPQHFGNRLASLGGKGRSSLPAATGPPAPAPPALIRHRHRPSHPTRTPSPSRSYWTLPQSGGFSLAGLTTLAYFSIGVNADGSLDQTGSGWNGYESQALTNLITRAHGANERVVLTVNDFDQGSLNALTSSATAPTHPGPGAEERPAGQEPRWRQLRLRGRGQRGPGRTDPADQLGVVGPADGRPALAGDDGHLRLLGRRPGRVLQHPCAGPLGGCLLRHGLRAQPAGHAHPGLAADQRPVQRPDHPAAVHRRRPGLQGHPWASGSSASTGPPATAPCRPRRPAGPPTSPTPRCRAVVIRPTGTRSPTPAGRATRSAPSGTSPTGRTRTGSTWCPNWPPASVSAGWGSGPSAWRKTTPR